MDEFEEGFRQGLHRIDTLTSPVPAIDADELRSRAERQPRQWSWRAQPWLAAAAAVVLVAGVAVGAGLALRPWQPVPAVPAPPSAPQQTVGTVSTPAVSPTSSPTECPPPASLVWNDGTLSNGKHFGWVRYFDGEAIYLDPAEWFSNDEAIEAAREDGVIGQDEDLPDPFYIRDPDSDVVRIPVADQFTITVIDAENYPAERELNRAAFAQLYCPGADAAWMYSPPNQLPAHLEVSADQATRATEQYMP